MGEWSLAHVAHRRFRTGKLALAHATRLSTAR